MTDAEVRDRIRELRERLAAGDTPARPRSDDRQATRAEAADGRVRVDVTGGRFTAIQLDPRVMRMDAGALGALLTETCNTALERAAAATADSESPPVDFAALAGQLQQVQSEGLHQMERMMQGLHESIQVIRERAIVRGDIGGTGGLEQLLQTTVDEVAAMSRPKAESGELPERPVGRGMSDLIRVTAESTTRLGEITLDEAAMRRASHEIADETVRAANQALEMARTAAAEHGPQSPADLAATVARMQDASLEQLSTLTESLGRLMRGIDRP